jgi:tetratricopeptide (TPR) repeat protein
VESYRQALEIREELGDKPGVRNTYHQLSNVTFLGGRLDEAEEWSRKALVIGEQLGDKPGMATIYHQLGIIAHARGRLDEAEDWYRKSLAIKQELGDRPGMASTFGQLGMLAGHRGRPFEDLEWTIRCIALFSEFPHPATEPAPGHLARLAAQLRMGALERYWRLVTGDPLPATIRRYVQSPQAKQ